MNRWAKLLAGTAALGAAGAGVYLFATGAGRRPGSSFVELDQVEGDEVGADIDGAGHAVVVCTHCASKLDDPRMRALLAMIGSRER